MPGRDFEMGPICNNSVYISQVASNSNRSWQVYYIQVLPVVVVYKEIARQYIGTMCLVYFSALLVSACLVDIILQAGNKQVLLSPVQKCSKLSNNRLSRPTRQHKRHLGGANLDVRSRSLLKAVSLLIPAHLLVGCMFSAPLVLRRASPQTKGPKLHQHLLLLLYMLKSNRGFNQPNIGRVSDVYNANSPWRCFLRVHTAGNKLAVEVLILKSQLWDR